LGRKVERTLVKVIAAATVSLVMGASLLAQTPAQKPVSAPQGASARETAYAGDRIFGLTNLHKIRLSVSAAEWAVLQTSTARGSGVIGGSNYLAADGRLIHAGSGFGGYFPWVKADLRVDGLEFKAVGLRYKGNFSFTSSSASAPLFANFKMKIDTHGTRGSWDGEKTFNFHAGVIDTSKMRDAIAYHVFRAAGVPAPRTAFAELVFTVPGIYNEVSAGLFTIVEDVNRKFLERVLPPGTGLLMKPEGMRGGMQSLGDTWAPYVPTLRPDRDATPAEQARVMAFGALISQPDVARFRAGIGSFIDVDAFLRFIAVHALIVNNDSYLRGGHNFYIYLDPSSNKFQFIPWDQDLSLGARPGGQGSLGAQVDVLRPFTGDQPLLYWLLDDPAVAARYRDIIRELATTVFTKAKIMELVDTLEKVGTGRGSSPRAFLESRTDYIQQLVAGWK